MFTEILSFWLIIQFIVLGITGTRLYNSHLEPKQTKGRYDHKLPLLIGILFPILFFGDAERIKRR